MRHIRILDCTLRDGGFVNDWDFGIGSLKSIVSRLIAAKVDFVELGWLDRRRELDVNRAILPGTAGYRTMMDGIDRGDSTIVGMIDYGTCPLELIEPASESVFDGIRVIFKKKDADAALDYCRAIKELGYKLFVQPVSITTYTDEDMKQLLAKVDQIQPFSVAIVDTYGLMHRDQLLHYFELMDQALSPEVCMGYHSHNNFQLAYSNSIELASLKTERQLVIDSTLYGMGKGAGNTNTELLAMYLNSRHGTEYGLDHILEAIEVDILKEYKKAPWGYSFNYYLSAMNDCHPDYVKTLVAKKTLSVASINRILSRLPADSRLSFNKTTVEDLYESHKALELDDTQAVEALSNKLTGIPVLLLAPGHNLQIERERVEHFRDQERIPTISVNFLPLCDSVDFAFFSTSKRFSQYLHRVQAEKGRTTVLTTSNVEPIESLVGHRFSLETLRIDNPFIGENPVVLLINLLERVGVTRIYLAGFDGYNGDNQSDYSTEHVSFLYCNENVVDRNEAMRNYLRSLNGRMDVRTITTSHYLP